MRTEELILPLPNRRLSAVIACELKLLTNSRRSVSGRLLTTALFMLRVGSEKSLMRFREERRD